MAVVRSSPVGTCSDPRSGNRTFEFTEIRSGFVGTRSALAEPWFGGGSADATNTNGRSLGIPHRKTGANPKN